jgi:hypothetical protein
LTGAVEFVIGVDTHRDSHTAAVVAAATGGVVEHSECTGRRPIMGAAPKQTAIGAGRRHEADH